MEGEQIDEKEIKIERRYAVLQVTPEFLIELAKGTNIKRICVEEFALPPDARIVGVGRMNWNRESWVFETAGHIIGILVQSETFEDVPIGNQIPILNPPKFKLIEEAPKGFESKCPACGELSLNSINEGATMVKIECANCGWKKYT